jgi:DnaJ-class molecular chaperone
MKLKIAFVKNKKRKKKMEIQIAKELLGLAAFTLAELKAAFRKLSFKHHPDVGGKPEKFRELTEAFETLKSRTTIAEEIKEGRLHDGTLITELGKGFPITESAKTCDACDGKGYSVSREKDIGLVECPDCQGTRVRHYPCRACNGSGRYQNRVDCRLCKGSGKFYPKSKGYGAWPFWIPQAYIPGTVYVGLPCKKCGGEGSLNQPIATERINYVRCWECHGVGEIKMWNPVIPRGLFAKN